MANGRVNQAIEMEPRPPPRRREAATATTIAASLSRSREATTIIPPPRSDDSDRHDTTALPKNVTVEVNVVPHGDGGADDDELNINPPTPCQ